ncbi:MAG: HlyC/CorC family transporter [Hyphomicrobiaceae bacterium]|nr:MAG: HlyC/CorC family transporter [Hyphomicrobiaceae bacterium]
MFEITVVLVLVALNGLFALSELAVVSARRSRLRALAQEGRKGANRALALAAEPGRFLSTVQIGITAVGLIAGAYSGATLTADLGWFLRSQGMPDGAADWLAYVAVFSAITYLSLIIGELVPKNLALRNAESIACAVAPLMTTLSRIAAPAVWLLDVSTKTVFFLLRHKAPPQSTVTEEEIKALIAEAERVGVLETGEHRMIAGVLRLGDRPVRGLMTPRTDVDWLDVTADADAIRERILTTTHSRLPAGEGSPDKLIGVVTTRELLALVASGKPLDARAHVRKAPVIPETTDALDTLELLRDAEVPVALVHDEYGDFEGLVTPADVLEAIAGAFRSDTAGEEPAAIPRDDGSWFLAGWMPADEMADQLGITLPQRRDYQTVAGFVLVHLGRLPAVGERVDVSGWRFEVVDLDGRRIDKVLASRIPVTRRQL